MIVAINSTPLLMSEQIQHASAPVTPAQTLTPDADAEARRLSQAVARGDEAAFRELYDGYHHRVFRLAWVLSHGNESLAHDTVQSVFVTAAAKLRRVESSEHLWNWLARIARQHLAKSRRQSRRDSSVIGMAEVPEYHDLATSDSVLEERLDLALRTLEAEERQLVEWFYFDDLSCRQIAERLGATPKAISSRLERARNRLRSSLIRKASS